MHRISLLFLLIVASNSASAQCYPDRHNSSIYNGWISCEASPNPNELRGDGHWIRYDFDKSYAINGISLWNTNHPDFLTSGINRFHIDISLDGITWSDAGTHELPMSSGLSTYEGIMLESWVPAEARYILISAESNHGGSCTGFSEVNFDVQDRTTSIDELVLVDHLKVYPNPFSRQATLELTELSSGKYRIQIVDVLGRIAMTDEVFIQSSQTKHLLRSDGLADGYYVLKVYGVEVFQSIPITVFSGR